MNRALSNPPMHRRQGRRQQPGDPARRAGPRRHGDHRARPGGFYRDLIAGRILRAGDPARRDRARGWRVRTGCCSSTARSGWATCARRMTFLAPAGPRRPRSGTPGWAVRSAWATPSTASRMAYVMNQMARRALRQPARLPPGRGRLRLAVIPAVIASLHRDPAADRQRLAGDVGGALGAQEGDEPATSCGRAETAQRDALGRSCRRRPGRVRVDPAEHRGVGRPRADHVAGHARRGPPPWRGSWPARTAPPWSPRRPPRRPIRPAPRLRR